MKSGQSSTVIFGINYYLIADPENDSLIAYRLDGSKYQKMDPPFEFLLEKDYIIKPDFSEVFK